MERSLQELGGLADWLRTDLTDSRSPRPLSASVTAVCIRRAGAALSAEDTERDQIRRALGEATGRQLATRRGQQ